MSQLWQVEDAPRKVPAGQRQEVPLRAVPWAGLQAVQEVEVPEHESQVESH
jgi:hypothetical protein